MKTASKLPESITKKPNFIIAGERRSGTSTLAKWIETHPEIYLHPLLDMAYFLDDDIRGKIKWSEGKVDLELWTENHSLADYCELFKDSGAGEIAIGEKSADYLFFEPCLQRIASFIPDIKIVITLRNPIDRAWSHYWNEVGKGREPLGFLDAINVESERTNASDVARVHLSYVKRGYYDESIQILFKYFERTQVKIIILEKLIRDPKLELKSLYEFLNVDSRVGYERIGIRYNHNWTTIPYSFWTKSKWLISVEKKFNNLYKSGLMKFIRDPYLRRKYIPRLEVITRRPQSSFKMHPEVRTRLSADFAPHIANLEKMLGVSLDEWR